MTAKRTDTHTDTNNNLLHRKLYDPVTLPSGIITTLFDPDCLTCVPRFVYNECVRAYSHQSPEAALTPENGYGTHS